MTEFAVILPAAGRSQRFGGRDKLLEPLAGATILQWAVEAFLVRQDVGEIVIATNDEHKARAALKSDPRIQFCGGGANRAESVANAIKTVSTAMAYVAIHDAARPLVSQELIDRTWAAAREHGAAAPAMPVRSTIKLAGSSLPTRAMGTLPRHMLWAAQTPQMGLRVEFLEAVEKCPIPLDEVTDDAQLLELAGKDVWLVEGEERNLKITTPIDLRVAEALLEKGQ
ncbi:MAG TPA: 2-C-methyl-D-erythritol 4-phosphate cytidylyltransferase [Tepidisphaeraceae bacterium]|jgi:2-C-methyl-D-erythritol 4-phosphate cytidylyltransferase|nr:2-C-methyl-D-erythritol 4-phosphate cytidylyltransferase [Tepidisphaeraceae bacterium]